MSKKVYDWHELVDAFANPPEIPSSPIADHVRSFVSGRKHCVQLTDRLVALATETDIDLLWAVTPRGEAVDRTMIQRWVSVLPAAGGRTTYAVDNTVDGHFANKHLPLRASDRAGGGRRTHRSTQWFCGRSGMYQKGAGPYYADVGPDFMNQGLEEFAASVHDACAHGLPSEWAYAAVAMCRRVAAAVAPFRDVVLRYESCLPHEEDKHDYSERDLAKLLRIHCKPIGMRHHPGVSASYGVRIRLKSPHEIADGYYLAVPDFSATVLGPDPMSEVSADIAYAGELLHACGRRTASPFYDPHSSRSFKTSIDRMLYSKPTEVLEAARQWAASRVFIPA